MVTSITTQIYSPPKLNLKKLKQLYIFINIFLVPPKPCDKFISSEKSIENGGEFENLVMQAIDGFLLVLSADGDIIFVSENVAEILGIQQVII